MHLVVIGVVDKFVLVVDWHDVTVALAARGLGPADFLRRRAVVAGLAHLLYAFLAAIVERLQRLVIRVHHLLVFHDPHLHLLLVRRARSLTHAKRRALLLLLSLFGGHASAWAFTTLRTARIDLALGGLLRVDVLLDPLKLLLEVVQIEALPRRLGLLLWKLLIWLVSPPHAQCCCCFFFSF